MNASDFAAFPTGNLCNASPEVMVLPSAIRPLIAGRRVAGRAITARIQPGQNAAIHEAVHNAMPGDLLIVDGGGSDRFGPFGDLLAECCKMRGIVAAVFNCTTRDSTDIARLDFQIFSRGFHPEATAKTEPGETGVSVTIGRAQVAPGDIVVGDDDGVVVIPAGIASEVLERVADVARREEQIRARIVAGETTFDIFELGQRP